MAGVGILGAAELCDTFGGCRGTVVRLGTRLIRREISESGRSLVR